VFSIADIQRTSRTERLFTVKWQSADGKSLWQHVRKWGSEQKTKETVHVKLPACIKILH